MASAQQSHLRHNLPLNHIALSVPDLSATCAWYEKHFGFRRIRSDRASSRAVDGDAAPIFRIYGDALREVKIAWLVSGNGVGVEVFEFVEPPVDTKGDQQGEGGWSLEQQYQRGGLFHFCVTHPSPETLAKEACANGARQIGEMVDLGGGERALYLRDPWGTVVEVLSCGYETVMANKG